MLIREFLATDVDAVKKFTDAAIGLDYYSFSELQSLQKKSIAANGLICSFVLKDEDGGIHGLRLAFPAGSWQHGKGSQLRVDLWPTPLESTAYFQSLFVSSALQGQGWGPQLSEKSLGVLKKLGTQGIVAHCWKESPHNSSLKYLENLGFKQLIEHKDYWIDVDYVCTRDGKPCRCTAIEMHLDLRDNPV